MNGTEKLDLTEKPAGMPVSPDERNIEQSNKIEEKNRVIGGTLYLVATPIGNLADMSARAIKVLGEVDFIAAEDTRNTLKLLSLFGISKPLVSYF